MNEEQAKAVDIGIRAVAGATYSANKQEAALLLRARRTLEGMLSEGFLQCRECGRRPTPFAMLDGSDGWCAVCRCTRNNVYGRSLDEVREEWNEEVGP